MTTLKHCLVSVSSKEKLTLRNRVNKSMGKSWEKKLKWIFWSELGSATFQDSRHCCIILCNVTIETINKQISLCRELLCWFWSAVLGWNPNPKHWNFLTNIFFKKNRVFWMNLNIISDHILHFTFCKGGTMIREWKNWAKLLLSLTEVYLCLQSFLRFANNKDNIYFLMTHIFNNCT